MKILYLVNRETYYTKMSRVRFHGIKAMENLVDIRYWGLNWPNYNQNRTVQQNLDDMQETYDAVIAYKPLELKEFSKIKPLKVIRYNEMWNEEWTRKEINDSGSQLVICHHLNDYEKYEKMTIEGVKFVYLGHGANKNIFKDYKLKKEYDILLVGKLSWAYPLRTLFMNLMPHLKKKYKCHIHEHPGYDLKDSHTNKYLIEMAKVINKSKLVLTCSSKFKYRLGKYIEIPMSGAALCGDIPIGNDNFDYVININEKMPPQEIFNKICYYLDNDDKRLEKVELGYKFGELNTFELYGKNLINIIEEYLKQ